MQEEKTNPVGCVPGADLLVGSTGFVGGNLMASHRFAKAVHSRDIAESFGTKPDLCVYAGVPAAMFLANADPDADLAVMRTARENLRSIAPKQVVLVSSITVYADSRQKDENSAMELVGLPAYGTNRLQLENWVREDFPDCTIVRLPALYGVGLKKNFLYDLHTITPAMLRGEKYMALAEQSPLVGQGYTLNTNGFYTLNGSVPAAELRAFFVANTFNALAFTDSRSRYQFYPLARLWKDIGAALQNELPVLNLTTPPVTAAEVYTAVTGKTSWKNHLDKPPFDYDLRSCHAPLLGGENGYLCTEEQELADICAFMKNWRD